MSDAWDTLASIREIELKAAREYAWMRVQAHLERMRNVSAMEVEYEEMDVILDRVSNYPSHGFGR